MFQSLMAVIKLVKLVEKFVASSRVDLGLYKMSSAIVGQIGLPLPVGLVRSLALDCIVAQNISHNMAPIKNYVRRREGGGVAECDTL